MSLFDMAILGMDDVGEFFEDIADQNDEEVWWVGTIVEYAAAVEVGTSKQEPQPYLKPAVQEVKAKQAGMNVFGKKSDALRFAESVASELASEVERRAKDKAPVDTGNLRASIQKGQSIDDMKFNSAELSGHKR